MCSSDLDMRQANCETCGAAFLRSGKNAAKNRFCSVNCARRLLDRSKSAAGLRFYKGRLRDAKAAIAKFCQGCEPVDRVCRDGTCPLREFSPFPLVTVTRRVA